MCFSVTDQKGNAVSFIQSTYSGFGTGIVPKGYGFSLHNRGSGFSITNERHPNYLRGGNKPFHSIIPGMILRANGDLYCTFGNMGGAMQPQGHLQLVSKLIDFRIAPKRAINMPRWFVDHETHQTLESLKVEDGTDPAILEKLRQLGHDISKDSPVKGIHRLVFGRAHAILRLGKVEYGACETRSDGLCIALTF